MDDALIMRLVETGATIKEQTEAAVSQEMLACVERLGALLSAQASAAAGFRLFRHGA